jgi:hypothetical protein
MEGAPDGLEVSTGHRDVANRLYYTVPSCTSIIALEVLGSHDHEPALQRAQVRDRFAGSRSSGHPCPRLGEPEPRRVEIWDGLIAGAAEGDADRVAEIGADQPFTGGRAEHGEEGAAQSQIVPLDGDVVWSAEADDERFAGVGADEPLRGAAPENETSDKPACLRAIYR